MKADLMQDKVALLEKELVLLRQDNEKLSQQVNALTFSKNNGLNIFNGIEYNQTMTEEKQSQFLKLSELSLDAILFVDKYGVILDCNAACLKLFEYNSKEEFLVVMQHEVNKQFDKISSSTHHKKSFNVEGFLSLGKYFKTKSGRKFPAMVQSLSLDLQTPIFAFAIKDLASRKDKDQDNRVVFLCKIELLNQQFAKSHTHIQLNRALCKHFIKNTQATELCIIDNEVVSGIADARVYCIKKAKDTHMVEMPVQFTDEEFLRLQGFNNFEGVEKLKEEGCYNFNFFINNTLINNQVIVIIKVNNHKDKLICFNYANADDALEIDVEYLNYAFHQIKTAYEKLGFYEQLVEKEARFRALTENLNDLVLVRNKTGQISYVSSSIVNFGYDPADILGKNSLDFILAEDAPIVLKAMEDVLQNPGKSFVLNNIRLQWKTERRFVVNVVLTNLYHLKGVKGIVICIQDNTDKVEVLKQIHESEEKYSTLLENANDGICILKSNKIFYANKMLNQLLRAESNALIGKTVFDFSSPLQANGIDSDAFSATFLRKVLKGENQSFDWRFKRIDNTEFDGQVSLSRINLLDGVYFMVIIRDVSEIKLAHQKIKENEERLSSIFESMNDGVYLSSLDCNIEYVNKAMQKQANISLLGRKCFQEIFGFEESCKWCKIHDLKENEHKIIEIYNSKTNRHFQISKSLMKNSKGLLSVLHISRDVTEIKESQRMIKQSEEKFRNIFNLSNDAIFITTLEGVFIEVNERLLTRWGFLREDVIGHDVTEFKAIISPDKVAKYFQGIKNSKLAVLEFNYSKIDMDELVFEVCGQVIDYLGSKAVLHVSRDVTLRKDVERRVLDSTIKTEEKERSRFARDLHDGIGPYLSATKFFLNTISRENDIEARNVIIEKVKDSIDEIISNVKEISNNISPHILKNFGIIAALRAFNKKTKNKEVNIVIDTNIEADRFEENIEISVFRIIMELVNNTFKYANAKNIKINIMRLEQNLFVEFYDDGIGFNLNDKLKENKGMGLSNIINRVNALKGEFDMKSEAGSGFCFSASFRLI